MEKLPFWKNELYLHRLFDLSLIAKGILATIETIGGIVAFFISQQFIVNTIFSITADTLSDDPNDFVANALVHIASKLSVSSQHFFALYLLSHGIVKGFLVYNLFKEKLWAYPLAMSIFSFFGIYQIIEYIRHGSTWLIALTLLDVVIIYLTAHEYRYMKKTGIKPKWNGGEKSV